jgi:hypothetical protein
MIQLNSMSYSFFKKIAFPGALVGALMGGTSGCSITQGVERVQNQSPHWVLAVFQHVSGPLLMFSAEKPVFEENICCIQNNGGNSIQSFPKNLCAFVEMDGAGKWKQDLLVELKKRLKENGVSFEEEALDKEFQEQLEDPKPVWKRSQVPSPNKPVQKNQAPQKNGGI